MFAPKIIGLAIGFLSNKLFGFGPHNSVGKGKLGSPSSIPGCPIIISTTDHSRAVKIGPFDE